MPEDDGERETLRERVTRLMLKSGPSHEAKPGPFDELHTVDEIEPVVKRATDSERLVGLVAAPLAGMIALIVTGSLIANDPKAHLANGALNKLHVNPSLYVEIGGVALLLAVLMLAFAWFRKRVYLAVVTVLYGLSIFNLKFWGFGLPFILVGAWLLVRAYRLNTKLKQAREAGGGPPSTRAPGSKAAPNKRFTPKSVPRGTSSRSTGKERRAG